MNSFRFFLFSIKFGVLDLFYTYLFDFIPLLISTTNLYFIGFLAKFKLINVLLWEIAIDKAYPAIDSKLLSFKFSIFNFLLFFNPFAKQTPPWSLIRQEEKSTLIKDVFVSNYSPKVITPSSVKWFLDKLITCNVLLVLRPYPKAVPPQYSN